MAEKRYDFTRRCYAAGAWPSIVVHPGYNLGMREIAALELLTLQIKDCVSSRVRICHLAVGTGREVGCFICILPQISEYVLVDICVEMLEEATKQSLASYPRVKFTGRVGDIEDPDVLSELRKEELGIPHIFVLVGNCVIFADNLFDDELEKAMMPGDLFLITAEMPHKSMYDSYRIKPVYDLLSNGEEVDEAEFSISFNEETSCLEISRRGQVVLASYKPTPDQLKERLSCIGLEEVVFMEFSDLHMIGGLFRKF